MSNGTDIAHAAMRRLGPDVIKQHGGALGLSLATATELVSGLTGTKAELTEAIAYLALQVAAYRKIANEDAALAIHNIESIVKRYREMSA